MTMEEVNERFPLAKYKAWRTARAERGLPSAGGIDTAASRPASLRNVERDTSLPAPTTTNTVSTVDEKAGPVENGESGLQKRDTVATEVPGSIQHRSDTATTTAESDSPLGKTTSHEEGDEEAEQIQHAIPAEHLPDPGDACAICLDTIEDDDDIRGLNCGHAFHASCVDPWLTGRRACCPLCKADYYVPKPRSEGSEQDELRRGAGSGVGNMPAPPQFAFIGRGGGGAFGRRPNMGLPGRFMTIVHDDRDRNGIPRIIRQDRPSRAERRRQRNLNAATAVAGEENGTGPTQQTWRQRLANVRALNAIPSIPAFSRRATRGETENVNSVADATVTPAQLEAGRQGTGAA